MNVSVMHSVSLYLCTYDENLNGNSKDRNTAEARDMGTNNAFFPSRL